MIDWRKWAVLIFRSPELGSVPGLTKELPVSMQVSGSLQRLLSGFFSSNKQLCLGVIKEHFDLLLPGEPKPD